MRLLVAQDDAGLRSVLERGLLESGYVVDAVGDGEQALRFLCNYERRDGPRPPLGTTAELRPVRSGRCRVSEAIESTLTILERYNSYRWFTGGAQTALNVACESGSMSPRSQSSWCGSHE